MARARQLLTVVSLSVVVGVPPFTRIAEADQGPHEAGPEIWVSGPTTFGVSGADDFPDVGVDDRGRRIYVWTLHDPDANIALRRFGAAGNELEDPRLINITTELSQDRPRVAVAADGSFMVVWQSSEDDGGSNSRWIRGQAFGSNGVAVGAEQLVSDPSSGSAALVDFDVAALRVADGSNGGFVVVWDSFNTAGSDNDSTNIQGQIISAAGVPTGPPFQVNATTPGRQRKPAVAEMADGGFLVVWIEPHVQGRRFNAAGAPQGGQFRIDTEFPIGIKGEPDVAIGWDGVIAVAWEDSDDVGDVDEIRARLFDRELSPQGPDFRVNDLISGDQRTPRLGDYGPFGFLVTWSSPGVSAGSDNDDSVQARLVTGPGTFGGTQIQYNVWETNAQKTPVSHGWYGRLGSAWEGVGNDQDALHDHVTGRQIEACVYCDDLEWGSLWRWSAALGESP